LIQPATDWLEGKIDLGKKGVITINHHQQTSAKDVYAGGDATLVPFAPVEDSGCTPTANSTVSASYSFLSVITLVTLPCSSPFKD
jgi:alkyl hydroperoxide reductase subunit AhpF